MEKVGPQVAPQIFMPQAVSRRFCEPPLAGKKRGIPPPYNNQQHSAYQIPRDQGEAWTPNAWEWDSSRFVGRLRPNNQGIVINSNHPQPSPQNHNNSIYAKDGDSGVSISMTSKSCSTDEEDNDILRLKLGGVAGTAPLINNSRDEPSSSRPNKKSRSGSPGNGTGSGGASYPMCQVDDCREDLSKSKDYHRRHKVCEVHSKATQAFVGKQKQRFCQQCSRFHPLSEFDEGKRSCRRRLAGHNRRRRKTQPEDSVSHIPNPSNTNNSANGNLDIVNLLAVLARAQGSFEQKAPVCTSLPDQNQLVQLLSKINPTQLPNEMAAKLLGLANPSKNILEQAALDHSRLNGPAPAPAPPASKLTMDLLAATLAASAPDALAVLSQMRNQGIDSQNKKLFGQDGDTTTGLQSSDKQPVEFHSIAGEKSSSSHQSPIEDSDNHAQDTRSSLELQLFTPSPEHDSPPKLPYARNYYSSDSSNPMEERSPSSSPPMTRKLFPLHSDSEDARSDRTSLNVAVNAQLEAGQNRGHDSNTTLELFGVTIKGRNNNPKPSLPPYRAGYASSSGSDYSPPSFNSDAQDRTGQILFKLFDKDPSQLPDSLRTQIYNWLSNSPSDMESYIRPGCIVVSVYVCMPAAIWLQFEENLLQQVSSLVQGSDSDFWTSGRFLVHAGRKTASYADGRVRLRKLGSRHSFPQVLSVSPLAVVGGQDTSLILRGRNLTFPGTRVHCTNMGGYKSVENFGSVHRESMYDEITLKGFKVHDGGPTVVGRCFIEVENGLRSSSFPVIVANASICQELKLLEHELNGEAKVSSVITEDEGQSTEAPNSKEEIVQFLNELGWLFQRKTYSELGDPRNMQRRFQFLFIFSIERDYSALVRTLLDLVVEWFSREDGLSGEPLEALMKLQLLNRAVKRKCKNMVDLLIHYAVTSDDGTSKKYIFPPNLVGPGGLTPLHLAACMSGSYDIVDALTNDPQEIGLHCWSTILDEDGQSPHAYAAMRNNDPYNDLVTRKLTDRRNFQVSLSIENEINESSAAAQQKQRTNPQMKSGPQSCSKCAVALHRRMSGSHGLLHRPYIHSMLAIAAVCVCVCLFYRGAPQIGSVSPFKWENLDFGTM